MPEAATLAHAAVECLDAVLSPAKNDPDQTGETLSMAEAEFRWRGQAYELVLRKLG